MVASLNVGCRVEGSHGEFLPAPCNPDGSQVKRRKRQRLEGTILEARGEKRWLVRFDTGMEKECPSMSLKLLRDPRYNAETRAPTALISEAPQSTSASVAPAPCQMASLEVLPQGSDPAPMESVAVMPQIPLEAAVSGASATALIPSISAIPMLPIPMAEAAVVASMPTITATATNLIPSIPAIPMQQIPIAEAAAVASNPNPTAAAETATTLTSATVPAAGPIREASEEEVGVEEADLNDVEDEIQQENDEDAGFDVVENVTADVHQQRRIDCEVIKQQLIESNWTIIAKSGNVELTWNVVPDSIPECPMKEFESLGIRSMDWAQFDELKKMAKSGKKKDKMPQPFFDLFLLLWPGDWRSQLAQLNDSIVRDYAMKSKNKPNARRIKPISESEFFTFFGIIILSGAMGKGGSLLFEKEMDRQKEGVFRMTPCINFSPYMGLRRFEDIKAYFPLAFADFDKKDPLDPNHDPWYMISRLIDDFNNNRKKGVAASVIKVLDELMSAWRPRKNKTGGLPNISFILRKPEPLGTEFKCGACAATGTK